MHRIAIAALVGSAGLTLAACEIPESPEWDVVVAAPFNSDRLEIDDFLPSEVGTADVGGTRVFTVPGIREQSSLQFSSICPTCPSGTMHWMHSNPGGPLLDRHGGNTVHIVYQDPNLSTKSDVIYAIGGTDGFDEEECDSLAPVHD